MSSINETDVVPFDEYESKTLIAPSVGTSILPSNASDAQTPSTNNKALPIIIERDYSSSTLSSYCISNQRPDNHGDESVLIESAGERISTEKTNKCNAGTTTKQLRTEIGRASCRERV